MLFEVTYAKRLVPEKIDELFELLDEEKKGYVALESFYNLIDLIENNNTIAKPDIV